MTSTTTILEAASPVPSTCDNSNILNDIVSANQRMAQTDEMKDVIGLASANAILNLHKLRRIVNTYLANCNAFKLGKMELKKACRFALASTIELVCRE